MMNRRTYIAAASVLAIMIFDFFVYAKMEGSGKKLPRCFPTGEIFLYKDVYGNIKYDSVYHTIADFKLIDQNRNIITNQS